MKKKKIILVGAGGHAKSCIDAIESQSIFQIAGMVGTESELGSFVCGYEVIATDESISKLARSYRYALIAVGQITSHKYRKRLFEITQRAGFEMPVVISSTSYVSKYALVLNGTIILNGAVVNADAKVGENCIINSKSLIEHDVKVGNHCHISTGAVLNGNVSVGEGCFVGSGAIIKEGISIAPYSIIGMSTSIKKDFHSNLTSSKEEL